MNRTEQIKDAYFLHTQGSFQSKIEPFNDFMSGAEWADSHPNNPWIRVGEHYPPSRIDAIPTHENTKDAQLYCIRGGREGYNVCYLGRDRAYNDKTGEYEEVFNNDGIPVYAWYADCLSPIETLGEDDYYLPIPTLPKVCENF